MACFKEKTFDIAIIEPYRPQFELIEKLGTIMVFIVQLAFENHNLVLYRFP